MKDRSSRNVDNVGNRMRWENKNCSSSSKSMEILKEFSTQWKRRPEGW